MSRNTLALEHSLSRTWDRSSLCLKTSILSSEMFSPNLEIFFNATFEALVAGRVRTYGALGIFPRLVSLAPALGSGRLEG